MHIDNQFDRSPAQPQVAIKACTQMRHSEQTKSDTDTPEKKNDVSTAALLHTVVFIDCAGLLVSYRHPMAVSD